MDEKVVSILKKECIKVNGRLPRLGHEMRVKTETKYFLFEKLPAFSGTYAIETWLQNNSGKFEIRTYSHRI